MLKLCGSGRLGTAVFFRLRPPLERPLSLGELLSHHNRDAAQLRLWHPRLPAPFLCLEPAGRVNIQLKSQASGTAVGQNSTLNKLHFWVPCCEGVQRTGHGGPRQRAMQGNACT